MEDKPNKRTIQLWKTLRQEEYDTAYLYQFISTCEPSPQLKEIYRMMAESETHHAVAYESKLKEAGFTLKPWKPGFKTKMLKSSAKIFGYDSLIPILMANEREGKNNYSTVPEIMDSSKAADESSHERLLSSILGNSGMEGSALARMEGRHRGGGGNALRAAVLGANDGLVSNLSLVMGVAGAALENHMILITGFAGLLAGAISMALGEWISVQSSRELFEHQLAIEKEEIENSPQEEEMELSLIYQAKGIPEKQAAELAKHVLSNPETSLDTLAREELGMDPDELGGSPWVAAGSSFLLFALGAILPVIPFLFLAGLPAVVFSLCLSSLGLFLIGGGTTLFTGKHFFFSAFRMILFGLMAAGVTFGIGKLIGIAIH